MFGQKSWEINKFSVLGPISKPLVQLVNSPQRMVYRKLDLISFSAGNTGVVRWG